MARNKLFAGRIASQRRELVYLVRGKFEGRDAWHYVQVEKSKLALFRQRLQEGALDVALYGEVLYSGWGTEPPPHVEAAMEKRFGS